MHELSITREIVALATEKAGGRRVTRIALVIGRLSGIVADAIRFCFDVCVQSTPAEGARLEIEEIPGRGRCRVCGLELPMDQPFGQCECGSARIELIAGHEMRIKEMEVD
ncbi:MAG: hydrogenase maturation nickel metallochaperone HypA [Kiritimatiellia bacterium]